MDWHGLKTVIGLFQILKIDNFYQIFDISISLIVGEDFFDFDVDEYEEVEQLPWATRQYARRFQRGEITWHQLRARADAAGMAETNAPAREAAEGA